MAFIADKQTLEDLNLLGKYKSNSIFNLFNQVHTRGGGKLLDEMFQQPLTNPVEINRRSEIFRYFQMKSLVFPVTNEQFTRMENYLGSGEDANIAMAALNTIRKKVLATAIKDEEYKTIHAGLHATIHVLNICRDFLIRLEEIGQENRFQEKISQSVIFLNGEHMAWLPGERNTKNLSLPKFIRYDYLLRHGLKEEIKEFLNVMYWLDVYISVSNIANAKGFTYAKAFPKEQNIFQAKALKHPALDKAVANDISFNAETNTAFLTGANMAGKSTFMKTVGVALYLAHMGFPIATEALEFSVKDGIYSSINVPDDLNQGLSHFYAEVMRVKKVAEEVSSPKSLFIIFDELFKGTNVKDAYDATVAVTQAFSEHRNCFYIISTHIIEAGDALGTITNNLQFVYFPTVMKEGVPTYPYTIKQGITADRQGMMIIENESILELIQNEDERG
jgi:DNA mismatch repair protein MutS